MDYEFSNKKRGIFWKKVYIYSVASSLNLVSFVLGVTFSWASPCLPSLDGTTNPDLNPLNPPITLNQGSWLVAIIFLGAMLGNFITMLMVPKLGRRLGLILLIMPTIFAYIVFSFCGNLVAFYIARFCCGITLGASLQMVPVFIGEIISKENRGAVGCYFAIFLATGQLYVYSIGPLMTFQHFNMVNLVFPLLAFILIIVLVDESPYHLVAKGDTSAAAQILTKLRPGKSTKDIEEEMDEICLAVKKKQEQLSIKQLLSSRPLRSSLIISTGLQMSIQLAIINPIVSYMETIFAATGSTISPTLSPVLVALLQLVSVLTIPHVVDRFGRRILLLAGQIMVTVTIFCLGVYFFLKDETDFDVGTISWLPLASIVVYIMFFGMGVGSVTYVVIGEIFPENAKNISSMIAVFITNVVAFAILFIYPLIEDSIGAGYTFWIFSGLCALTAVFVAVFVPETKGKSLAEIQQMLDKN